MSDTNRGGLTGRDTGSSYDRDDTSLTRSQTGHDTDGRSPDYAGTAPETGVGGFGHDDGTATRDYTARSGGAGDGMERALDRATGGYDDPNRGPLDRAENALSRSAGGVAAATTTDSLGNNVDGAGRDRTDVIASDETGKLISADKVIGTAVYNARGDRLGTIDSIMIHKISGRVAYAVMSFGGFLGIGERYHPLPWDVLTYDEEKGGYNIDADESRLRNAPHYSRDELAHLNDDRSQGTRIRDYYGVGAQGSLTSGMGQDTRY